ncbi:hypothetical protein BKA62DRAFT_825210 [Auriculariales sp. MPI-PUGE-AT-0066]|nr:hypothetical protein BKA62DRAFT_825210 [Auriculariales sp. MPI-PUGE-AT-0066]
MATAPARTYSLKRKLSSLDGSGVSATVLPPRKKSAISVTPRAKPKPVQMHLAFNQNPLKTCKICALTYTRGVPDDEALHKTHCTRVQKGLEWIREEDKGITIIEPAAMLSGGTEGRILAVRADASGKLGNKLGSIMHTIDLALSAPALSQASLKATKAYLFLCKPKGASREHVAGCLLAQRITSAFAVLETHNEPDVTSTAVDSVQYDPTPLPTPLGIPRIFVACAYRRKGVASALFSAAARTAVHGCTLSSVEGHIAFSQPTGDGRIFMNNMHITRVYEEDSGEPSNPS